MPRILSFTIFAFLKLTIVLTQSIHSMVLNVCYTIENLFQLNSALTASITEASHSTHDASSVISNNTYVKGVAASTQTAFNHIFPGCLYRSSNTDILIYNLNSAKKITITHKNLNDTHNSTNSYSGCETFQSEIEELDDKDTDSDNQSGDTFDASYSKLSQDKNSNMSIEKDVSNSRIILNSRVLSVSECVNDLTNKSTQYLLSDCRKNETTVSKFENLEPEESDEKELHKETFMKNQKKEPVQYQTSSPFDNSMQHPDDKEVEFELEAFHNCQNTAEIKRIQISKRKEKFRKSDHLNKANSSLENTILLDDCVKKRLSLSPNIKSNAAKTAALSLKTIQDEILESAKTPLREMNMKEIKYPYSAEMSSILQALDDKEEAKGIFSSSSYESLPVSDHIRTAIEKNILSSLYTENFANVTEPDFSSVDSLVEAFRKFGSSVSICEPIRNGISVGFASNKNVKNTFCRNLSVEYLEVDKTRNQTNMRKALSSGMLCDSNCHYASKKDGSSNCSTESEYQNHNSSLEVMNDTNYKSRTSISSIPKDEESSNDEKSESSDKTTKSDNGLENISAKTEVICNENQTNLALDVVSTNNDERNNDSNRCNESSKSNSNLIQLLEIRNLSEYNKENNGVPRKSPEINVNLQNEAEQSVIRNWVSSTQLRTGKNMYARKSFTGSRSKIDQTSNSLKAISSPQTDELSEADRKVGCSENLSQDTNSDDSEKFQKSRIIEGEYSNETEDSINIDKSTNSSDLDEQSIQSMINNDIGDKYKFTFIEEEILTPESKEKSSINETEDNCSASAP